MAKITIRQLKKEETPPYDLLELADPSREVIDAYLPHSEVHLTVSGEKIIGIYVLVTLGQKEAIEIKNIAVLPELN